jgi:hypothetical protein
MERQTLNKLSKHLLPCAASAFFFVAAVAANAQNVDPNGTWTYVSDPIGNSTYVFEANAGQPTDLNGSTITINDTAGTYTLEAWNIDYDGTFFTTGTVNPDTDIISDSVDGWHGSFEIDNAGDPVTINGTANGGNEDKGYADGTLTISSTPDASSTLPLLFGGMTAMAGARFRLRRAGRG